MIPHYSSIDWINNNLQDGSKILYLGTACWFYLNHDYLTSADKSIDYMNIKISQFIWEPPFINTYNNTKIIGKTEKIAKIPDKTVKNLSV